MPTVGGHLKAVHPLPIAQDEAKTDDTQFLPVQSLPEPTIPAPPQPSEVELPVDNLPIQDLHNSLAHTDAGTNAKVVDLAQKTGQPEAFVAKNLPDVEKAAAKPSTSFFADLESQYPGTTQFLAQPKNMAVTHDDLPNLASHEGLVTNATAAHGYLDDIKAGAQESVLGLAVRGAMPETVLPADASLSHRLAFQASSLLLDLPVMAGAGIVSGIGGGIAGGAAGTATLPVVGTVGGAATGAAIGTGFGAWAIPAALREGLKQHYQNGDIKDASDLWNRTYQILKEGTKQGVVGLLTAGAGGAAKLAAGPAAQLVGGATGKALATGLPLAAEVGTMEVAGKTVEGQSPTWEGLAEGALLVGAMHGATGLSSKVIETRIEAAKTKTAKDFYTALGSTAEASKLRERLPEQYRAHIAEITRDAPVENVYIPVEAADQYLQSKNLDPKATLESFGAGASYDEAKATGGDIKIPLADWVDKVVGTEHFQALADDIKFNRDDLTNNQVEERKIEIQQKITDLQNQTQGQEAAASSADQVREQVATQLRDAGFTEAEVQHGSQLHEQFFKTLGEAMKTDPLELSKVLPLEIRDQSNQGLAGGVDKNGQPNRVLYQEPIRPPSEVEQLKAQLKSTEAALGTERALRRTSEVTGLRNKLAFDEDAALGWPTVTAMDMDGLKRLNDHIGHEAADQVMRELGGALLSAQGEGDNVRFYHRSGDEFAGRFKNEADAEQFMAAVQQKLESVRVGVEYDGKKYVVHGIGISFGTDKTYAGADKRANEQKVARFKSGQREDARGSGPSRRVLESTTAQTGVQGAGEATQSGRRVLEQRGPQDARGKITFADGKSVIDLFQHKDKSTFLHESGHYFLEVMGKVADMPNAPDYVKEDHATLLKWFGAEKTGDITSAHHEKFARAFESYLSEGNAPSEGLRKAFYHFKSWLTNLYGDVKKTLGIDLSPDVRGVMDRMLATKEEISHATEMSGYNQELVRDLDPKVAGKIVDLQERARDLAERSLMKQQMAELTVKNKEFLKAEREKALKEATQAVKALPLYVASDELGTVLRKKDVSGAAQLFIDGKLKDEDMAHFEVSAEENGFTSGLELAKQIKTSKDNNSFDNAIASRVDAAMAPHASLMNKPDIQVQALKAIHNDKMTELLALEHSILQGLISKAEIGAEATRRNRVEASTAAKAAKEQARTILSSKSTKEASAFQPYVTAERNAAVKVAKAMAKKDYEAAAKHKQEQMLNHALAAEAMRNREEAEKAVATLYDFANRGNDLLNMPYGFTKQIDRLLSASGFSEAKPEDLNTLVKTAQDMAGKGEDPKNIADATGLVADAGGRFAPETLPQFVDRINDAYHSLSLGDSLMNGITKSFKEMPLSELRELKAGVKSIAEVGKKYNRFLGEFKTVDIKQAAALFKASVDANIGTPYAERRLMGSARGSKLWDKVRWITDLPDTVAPEMVNVLTLTQYLDGGKLDGIAKDHIYRPLKAAENRKLARYEKMTKEINDLFSKFYTPKELSSYKTNEEFYESINRKLTKEEKLSIALNWGNEGNRDRIRNGYKVNDSQVGRLLDTLSKKDMDFVQSVWDHLETYWPEISALEMRVNGAEPKRVQPSELTTQHGTYKGGYYPIAYDFEKSADAYRNAEQKNALYKQFSATHAQTDTGHAKARVASVDRGIRLSMDVLFNHLENVVHDLEYREAVIDVNRFLKQRDVRSSLENAIGVKGAKGIDDWLKAVASDQGEFNSFGESAFKWFRFHTTFSTLAFRLFTVPLDLTGNVGNALWEIGPKRFGTAMKDFAMNGSDLKDFVDSKDPGMANRGKVRDRDVKDASKKWLGKDSAIKQFGFVTQAIADEAIAYPLWSEVYKHNLSEFGDKKATQMAGEAVAKVLGSGSTIDQVGAQRGSEYKKVTSMFFSWNSMMFNRAWLSGKIAGMEYRKGNTGAAIATIAKAAFFAWGFQSLQENFWRELFHNGQTDDKDARMKRIVSRTIQQPFGYLWLARDISSFLVDRAVGQQGANFRISPMEQAVESIVKPFGDAASIAFSSGKHFDRKFGEEAAKSASFVLGYPQQANSLVFNYLDWAQHNGAASWRDLLSRRTKK